MGMNFMDFLNKLGLHVPNPYSFKFNNNLLPVKLYANVLIGDIWHSVEISDIDFGKCGDTDNLCSLTFVGKENQDLKLDNKIDLTEDLLMLLIDMQISNKIKLMDMFYADTVTYGNYKIVVLECKVLDNVSFNEGEIKYHNGDIIRFYIGLDKEFERPIPITVEKIAEISGKYPEREIDLSFMNDILGGY